MCVASQGNNDDVASRAGPVVGTTSAVAGTRAVGQGAAMAAAAGSKRGDAELRHGDNAQTQQSTETVTCTLFKASQKLKPDDPNAKPVILYSRGYIGLSN